MTPEPKVEVPEQLSMESPKRICRFRNIMQLATSHSVHGAIIIQHKFCDCHGLDHPHVAQIFQFIGVPTIFLEIENLIPVGQLRVRVQAFTEMIQSENIW